MALYIKFCSIVTHLVLDVATGFIIFICVLKYTSFFVQLIHYASYHLHLEYLQQKVYWLLGYPAGFKPNLDLAHFFGNAILQLISVWNVVTSQLTQIKTYIILYLSLVGVLGLSI